MFDADDYKSANCDQSQATDSMLDMAGIGLGNYLLDLAAGDGE